jgi:hypothetical protein
MQAAAAAAKKAVVRKKTTKAAPVAKIPLPAIAAVGASGASGRFQKAASTAAYSPHRDRSFTGDLFTDNVILHFLDNKHDFKANFTVDRAKYDRPTARFNFLSGFGTTVNRWAIRRVFTFSRPCISAMFNGCDRAYGPPEPFGLAEAIRIAHPLEIRIPYNNANKQAFYKGILDAFGVYVNENGRLPVVVDYTYTLIQDTNGADIPPALRDGFHFCFNKEIYSDPAKIYRFEIRPENAVRETGDAVRRYGINGTVNQKFFLGIGTGTAEVSGTIAHTTVNYGDVLVEEYFETDKVAPNCIDICKKNFKEHLAGLTTNDPAFQDYCPQFVGDAEFAPVGRYSAENGPSKKVEKAAAQPIKKKCGDQLTGESCEIPITYVTSTDEEVIYGGPGNAMCVYASHDHLAVANQVLKGRPALLQYPDKSVSLYIPNGVAVPAAAIFPADSARQQHGGACTRRELRDTREFEASSEGGIIEKINENSDCLLDMLLLRLFPDNPEYEPLMIVKLFSILLPSVDYNETDLTFTRFDQLVGTNSHPDSMDYEGMPNLVAGIDGRYCILFKERGGGEYIFSLYALDTYKTIRDEYAILTESGHRGSYGEGWRREGEGRYNNRDRGGRAGGAGYDNRDRGGRAGGAGYDNRDRGGRASGAAHNRDNIRYEIIADETTRISRHSLPEGRHHGRPLLLATLSTRDLEFIIPRLRLRLGGLEGGGSSPSITALAIDLLSGKVKDHTKFIEKAQEYLYAVLHLVTRTEFCGLAVTEPLDLFVSRATAKDLEQGGYHVTAIPAILSGICDLIQLSSTVPSEVQSVILATLILLPSLLSESHPVEIQLLELYLSTFSDYKHDLNNDAKRLLKHTFVKPIVDQFKAQLTSFEETIQSKFRVIQKRGVQEPFEYSTLLEEILYKEYPLGHITLKVLPILNLLRSTPAPASKGAAVNYRQLIAEPGRAVNFEDRRELVPVGNFGGGGTKATRKLKRGERRDGRRSRHFTRKH